MCDKIITPNLPESAIPTYVYKRVQKVGENKYISPVMGEPMYFKKWMKAPKRDKDSLNTKKRGYDPSYCDLIELLTRKYRKKSYVSSSSFAAHHNGMWGSFRYYEDAKKADLRSNFIEDVEDVFGGKREKAFPTVVVKCEVKGTVHEANFSGWPSYLSSHIKIVEELGRVD